MAGKLEQHDVADLMRQYLERNSEAADDCEKITWEGRHPLRPAWNIKAVFGRKLDRAAKTLPGDPCDPFRLFVRLVLRFAFFGEKHTPGDGFDNGVPWDDDLIELYEEFVISITKQVGGRRSGQEGGIKTQSKREKGKEAPPRDDGRKTDVTPPKTPQEPSKPAQPAPTPEQIKMMEEIRRAEWRIDDARDEDEVIAILKEYQNAPYYKRLSATANSRLQWFRNIPF